MSSTLKDTITHGDTASFAKFCFENVNNTNCIRLLSITLDFLRCPLGSFIHLYSSVKTEKRATSETNAGDLFVGVQALL